MPTPAPAQIFLQLVQVMSDDNGYAFSITHAQSERGTALVARMLESGYDFGDPKDYDSGYWAIAACEDENLPDAPGSKDLYSLLNEIFNQE